MGHFMRTRWPILVSAVVMVLAIACGGGESTTPTEQSSTVEVPTATEVPSEAPTATDVASDALGTLEVRVTDQPGAEVSAVVLTVQNIEVSTSDGAESGWQTVLTGPFEFDLLQLDGVEEILGSAMLEVGRYQQIRLEIVSAQVTIPNGVRSAAVPSDKLRLVGGFEVVESETTIVTLDFDAQRSVVFVPGQGPQLKPVVKLLVRPPTNVAGTDGRTPCAGCGEELFNASGCTGCHSTGDNKVVGPGLAGVYERASSRSSLDADGYIEQSLRDPQAFVVDGFPRVMPSFDRFSPGEVRDLIAYLKTLQ